MWQVDYLTVIEVRFKIQLARLCAELTIKHSEGVMQLKQPGSLASMLSLPNQMTSTTAMSIVWGPLHVSFIIWNHSAHLMQIAQQHSKQGRQPQILFFTPEHDGNW